MDVILKKLRERMNQYADDLALGAATDFPNYREVVGIISGLAMAEREILDYLEKQRDLDE